MLIVAFWYVKAGRLQLVMSNYRNGGVSLNCLLPRLSSLVQLLQMIFLFCVFQLIQQFHFLVLQVLHLIWNQVNQLRAA